MCRNLRKDGLLGLSLLYTAWRVWKVPGDKLAWTTSMYLAFIFLALMLDAVL